MTRGKWYIMIIPQDKLIIDYDMTYKEFLQKFPDENAIMGYFT